MNTLGLIYKKIKSVSFDRREGFEEDFSEVCNLIDKQFQSGYFWAAFYSYYELFSHLVKIRYFGSDKYFFILDRIQAILACRFLSREELVEIFVNNPFLKKEFLNELRELIDSENFNKIKAKIDLVFSNLMKFEKDNIESLYFSISLHDFLKFLKFLKDEDISFDEEKVVQMIVNDIFSYEIKVISEKISDIIDFGLANRNFEKVRGLVRKILLKIMVYLYVNSKDFTDWKKIFLISTYENIGRYLRIVKDCEFSSFVYLLAAIENWFISNYGYCSKCIYQISRVTEDNFKREFFINLAIDIALFEVSFTEEINYWKKEINQRVHFEEKQEEFCALLQGIVNNFQQNLENIDIFEDLMLKIRNLCIGVTEKIKNEKKINLFSKFRLN